MLLGLGLSIGAHVALFVGLEGARPTRAAAPSPRPSPAPFRLVDVALTPRPEPQAPTVEAPQAPAPDTTRDDPARAASRAPERGAGPRVPTAEPRGPANSPAVAGQPSAGEGPAVAQRAAPRSGPHPGDVRAAPDARAPSIAFAPPASPPPDLLGDPVAEAEARLARRGERAEGGAIARGRALRIDGLDRPLVRQDDGSLLYRDPLFIAHVGRDGAVSFDGRAPIAAFDDAIVRFDLTAALMAANGEDIARSEKRRFLAATESLRAELCRTHQREALDRAIAELRVRLREVWHDPRVPAEVRRRRLFELWDDCIEAHDDPELARRGAAIRAIVLAFVRETLPRGSPDAYGEAELALLDARRSSRAHFRPYADGDAGVADAGP